MKATYIRKGNRIEVRNSENNTYENWKTFKTINEAKRASRKIQMDSQGGLGRGILATLS